MKILKKRMSEVLNELTKDKGVRRTAPYTESGIITNKYIYIYILKKKGLLFIALLLPRNRWSRVIRWTRGVIS